MDFVDGGQIASSDGVGYNVVKTASGEVVDKAHEDEKRRRAEADAMRGDGFRDERPLHEILKERKEAKAAELKEKNKHQAPKTLDEDEILFLEEELEKKRRMDAEIDRLRSEERRKYEMAIANRVISADAASSLSSSVPDAFSTTASASSSSQSFAGGAPTPSTSSESSSSVVGRPRDGVVMAPTMLDKKKPAFDSAAFLAQVFDGGASAESSGSGSGSGIDRDRKQKKRKKKKKKSRTKKNADEDKAEGSQNPPPPPKKKAKTTHNPLMALGDYGSSSEDDEGDAS